MAREARAAKREHAALVRRLERQAEERRKAEEERRKAEATERRKAEAEAAERRKAEAEAAERRKAEAEAAERRKAAATEQRKALEAAAKAQKESLDAEAAARQQAMAEHEEEMRRLDLRLRREQEERDRAWDRRFQQAREADDRLGVLGEGLVANDLLELLRDARLDVGSLAAGLRIEKDGERRAYDLVAFGPGDTVVLEVKFRLRREDVWKFRKRLADFRKWYPEPAPRRVLGAVVYLKAGAAALRAAERAGFYVIRGFDGTVRILNPEDFEATIY